jgi:hypothetical protein
MAESAQEGRYLYANTRYARGARHFDQEGFHQRQQERGRNDEIDYHQRYLDEFHSRQQERRRNDEIDDHQRYQDEVRDDAEEKNVNGRHNANYNGDRNQQDAQPVGNAQANFNGYVRVPLPDC